jgi:hypothetical protein
VKLTRFIVVSLILLAALGCYKRAMVPPLFDLESRQVLGIARFDCNEEGKLDAYATQKFMEAITRDQPVEIVEMPPVRDLLKEVGQKSLNPDALAAIADKYRIRTLITGEIEISDVRPKLTITPGFSYVGISADVEAALVARLVGTDNGATVWTGSARDERTVGYVSLGTGGHFMFDAHDPESAYGGLVDALVKNATRDFRHTWRFVKR